MKRYQNPSTFYTELSSDLLNSMKNHALRTLETETADWAITSYTILAVDMTPISLSVFADNNWNFVYQMSDPDGLAAFETIDRAASVLAAALKS